MEGRFASEGGRSRHLWPYEMLAVTVIKGGLEGKGWRRWLRSSAGRWWCGLLGLDVEYVERRLLERKRRRNTSLTGAGG